MRNLSSKMLYISALLTFFIHTFSTHVHAGWLDTMRSSISHNLLLSRRSACLALCCLGAGYLIGRFIYRTYLDTTPALDQSNPVDFSTCNEVQELVTGEQYCDAIVSDQSKDLIAYSSNNLYCKNSKVIIAHLKENKLQTRYICDNFCARSLAFHPTKAILAMGGFKSNTIILWLYEENSYHTIHAHSDTIEKLCWNSDGSQLASASNDGTAKIWSIGQEIKLKHVITPEPQNFEKQTNWINTLAFNSDGTYLAIDGQNSGITLWNIEDTTVSQEAIQGMPKTDQISKDTFSSLAFNPSHSNEIAIAGHNFIALYTIDTKKYEYILTSSTPFLHPKITYSQSGNYIGLVTNNLDTHYLAIIDLETKKAKLSPITMSKASPTWSACSFSPDESSLIWSSNFTEPVENSFIDKRTFQLSSWHNPFQK